MESAMYFSPLEVGRLYFVGTGGYTLTAVTSAVR